jgi:chromosomal replication initiation ATPase DnaA
MSQKNVFPHGQVQRPVESKTTEDAWKISSSASTCPHCGGAERLRLAVPYGDPSFGKSILCSCLEQRQEFLRHQQIREAARMDVFRESTFQTFNARIPGVQEACTASRDYAANPQGWLLLLGACGCGKTHLAAAVANRRLESGATVYFTTVPDLLDALRSAFAAPERYTHLFNWVREVELLVLDDLGAHQATVWSNEKLLQLLGYRAILTISTVITALPNEIERLDQRLRSLLSDRQLVRHVVIDKARDFRPQKVAK